MLVDLENRLAVIEDGMHDHAQRVHVRGRVAADGEYVLRGQVLRVRETKRREVGLPLFTCVLGLNEKTKHSILTYSNNTFFSGTSCLKSHLTS